MPLALRAWGFALSRGAFRDGSGSASAQCIPCGMCCGSYRYAKSAPRPGNAQSRRAFRDGTRSAGARCIRDVPEVAVAAPAAMRLPLRVLGYALARSAFRAVQLRLLPLCGERSATWLEVALSRGALPLPVFIWVFGLDWILR
jgi:hypothetical protein